MTARRGTLVQLTHKQMDRVIETVKNDGEVAGILATWEAVLGHPLELHEGTITAWDFGIPKVQATQILQTIFDHKGHGMDWMNSAPSAIEEGNPNYIEIEEPAHAERL